MIFSTITPRRPVPRVGPTSDNANFYSNQHFQISCQISTKDVCPTDHQYRCHVSENKAKERKKGSRIIMQAKLYTGCL